MPGREHAPTKPSAADSSKASRPDTPPNAASTSTLSPVSSKTAIRAISAPTLRARSRAIRPSSPDPSSSKSARSSAVSNGRPCPRRAPPIRSRRSMTLQFVQLLVVRTRQVDTAQIARTKGPASIPASPTRRGFTLRTASIAGEGRSEPRSRSSSRRRRAAQSCELRVVAIKPSAPLETPCATRTRDAVMREGDRKLQGNGRWRGS